MKSFLLLILSSIMTASIYSQSPDTTILLIPCQSGTLVIDGIDKGSVTADDAHPEKISFGDHYIQLKNDTKKFNLTLKVEHGMSTNLVRLGCEEKPGSQTIKLLEKKMTILGLVKPQTEKNTFGLDAGDELLITCNVLNKNGTVNLSVTRLDNGAEIYRKESVNSLDHERIPITQKGIYTVSLTTNALLSRDANLLLERAPGKNSNADFKTGVGYVSDTTWTEVMNTTTRVFSLTSGHTPRTAVKINLPPGTTYWTFWIGVGQESREQFKRLASSVTDALSDMNGKNPLVAIGLKVFPNLPVFNMTSTVSYHFTSGQDAAAFVAGNAYNYYNFKFAENISAEYGLLTNTGTDVTLCLDNKSAMVGQDVDIKVVAFAVKKRLAIDK